MSQPELATLLTTAVEQQIITPEQNAQILQLSQPQPQNLPLKIVVLLLSGIGGTCLVFGMVLLVSYRWWLIPVWIKISLFILSLITVYLMALITERRRPNLSHALYAIAAMLPAVGLALIVQIYHVNIPAGGLLLWGLITLALGILLQQTEILLVSLTVFYLNLFITGKFGILMEIEDFRIMLLSNIIAWPLMLWHYFWPDRRYLTWLHAIGCGFLLFNWSLFFIRLIELQSLKLLQEELDMLLHPLYVLLILSTLIILSVMYYWWRKRRQTVPQLTFYALWYGCISLFPLLAIIPNIHNILTLVVALDVSFLLIQWRHRVQHFAPTTRQYWFNTTLLSYWCILIMAVLKKDSTLYMINFWCMQALWLGIIINLLFLVKGSEIEKRSCRSQGYLQFIVQLVGLCCFYYAYFQHNIPVNTILLTVWFGMAIALMFQGWKRKQFDSFKFGSLLLLGWLLYTFVSIMYDFLSASILLLILGSSIIFIVLAMDKSYALMNSQKNPELSQ